MRLCKKIHPALDGKFLEVLHLRDIYTVTDFLRADPERVMNFAAGSFDGDVEDLREDLIDKAAADLQKLVLRPRPRYRFEVLRFN